MWIYFPYKNKFCKYQYHETFNFLSLCSASLFKLINNNSRILWACARAKMSRAYLLRGSGISRRAEKQRGIWGMWCEQPHQDVHRGFAYYPTWEWRNEVFCEQWTRELQKWSQATYWGSAQGWWTHHRVFYPNRWGCGAHHSFWFSTLWAQHYVNAHGYIVCRHRPCLLTPVPSLYARTIGSIYVSKTLFWDLGPCYVPFFLMV